MKKILLLAAVAAVLFLAKACLSTADAPLYAQKAAQAASLKAASAVRQEATVLAVAQALSIEREAAKDLVKGAAKGFRVGREAPLYALAGYTAVQAYRGCLGEAKTHQDCYIAGTAATQFGKAFGPRWQIWDDLQNELDVSHFCDPIGLEVEWAKIQRLMGQDGYGEIVLSAWDEAQCEDRNRRSLKFWSWLSGWAEVGIRLLS